MLIRLTLIFAICSFVTGVLCPAFSLSATSTSTVNISAIILSKGKCTFINNSATLDFGNLNPLDPQDVTIDTGDKLSFSCNGNGKKDITYAITVTGSFNGTAAAPRMLGGTAYLPYELSLDPASGNATPKDPLLLVVTGTVRGSNYQSLPVGSYRDDVVISITP